MINIFIIDKKEMILNQIPVKLVNSSRISEAAKFKIDDDQIRSLLAWLLVRFAVRVLFEEEADDLEVVYNPYGKPYFKDSNICFNISHSYSLVSVAVSNNEIGVDLELIDAHRSLKNSLIKRVFNEDEFIKYENNELALAPYFYKRWTEIEAYVKYKGYGLISRPNELDTSDAVTKSFMIEDYNMSEYYISVTSKDEDDISVHYLDLDDIVNELVDSLK